MFCRNGRRTQNGPDLYQLRTQHQTVMEGPDGFSLTISNMPHNKYDDPSSDLTHVRGLSGA
jgi:hypothetical protein